MKTADIKRHPMTPSYLEYSDRPSFDESASMEPSREICAMSIATLRQYCASLDRDNQQLRGELELARKRHYEQQASMQAVGSVSHHLEGEPVRVTLTAAGLSLPDGSSLYYMPEGVDSEGGSHDNQ